MSVLARTTAAATAVPIDIRPAGLKGRVRLVLEPGRFSHIRGTVADQSGRPVTGAMVRLDWTNDRFGGWASLEKMSTNASGRFVTRRSGPAIATVLRRERRARRVSVARGDSPAWRRARPRHNQFGRSMVDRIDRASRDHMISRDVAAWLARQLTTCTLRELAAVFGLGHADSVRNLTRRVDRALSDSRKLQQDIAAIRQEILKIGSNRPLGSTCDQIRSAGLRWLWFVLSSTGKTADRT